MNPPEEIDIRRPGDKMLICGECGREQRVPAGDWRKIIRDSGPNEDWDGILRCTDGHEPAPMHAFDGVYGCGDRLYQGRCCCGHVTMRSPDKDAVWRAIAIHMATPLQVALARREAERRPRLNRFICIHSQVGTEPCPQGCHKPSITRVTGGWATRP